jgi:hypothetical protein
LIIEVLNKVTGGKSGSDKLRTYVPEVRQYWSGTSLFSSKYHVGTLNSCYLRTYILLVPYDLHMSKVFKTVIKSVYMCKPVMSMARNHGHNLFYFLTNLHITLKYGSNSI